MDGGLRYFTYLQIFLCGFYNREHERWKEGIVECGGTVPILFDSDIVASHEATMSAGDLEFLKSASKYDVIILTERWLHESLNLRKAADVTHHRHALHKTWQPTESTQHTETDTETGMYIGSITIFGETETDNEIREPATDNRNPETDKQRSDIREPATDNLTNRESGIRNPANDSMMLSILRDLQTEIRQQGDVIRQQGDLLRQPGEDLRELNGEIQTGNRTPDHSPHHRPSLHRIPCQITRC